MVLLFLQQSNIKTGPVRCPTSGCGENHHPERFAAQRTCSYADVAFQAILVTFLRWSSFVDYLCLSYVNQSRHGSIIVSALPYQDLATVVKSNAQEEETWGTLLLARVSYGFHGSLAEVLD